MDSVDAVVVGAGVVGLAVARSLSLAGQSVVVVERHARPGEETSSRNSGVIHSGIYYPTGSAKARLCVRGRQLLYAYCELRHIPYRRCGKLIVAQATEVPKLQALAATASRNGVGNLDWLDGDAIREKEPVIRAEAGLWCPDTGIVSVPDLVAALHGDVENAGGNVVFKTEFTRAQPDGHGFLVQLDCDGEAMAIRTGLLINSAGLAAVGLLSRIDDYPSARIPDQFFAKGNYFEFTGRSPFRHLVYPMPGDAGLGVHATLDMAGRLRFGPDVEWLAASAGQFDYSVPAERGEKFIAAIREYWPDLPQGSLQPSYSGVRPKLVGPGAGAADFRVEGPARHGIPGLINLLGIESPGLTSSLAIAEEVRALAG